MAERTYISQTLQIGAEAALTPGTAVPANKRLSSIMITPKIEVDVSQFRPSGFKYPTIAAPTRGFTSGSYEGKGSFNELVYILGSVLTRAVVTTPPTGTTSRLWTYSPSAIANDDPRTYTFEQVSAERSHRISHAMFTGISYEFEARGEVNISGDWIGKALEDDITATASPTMVTLVPILENQIDVFLDGAAANIGTTKYTRILKGSIEITDRWQYLWTVDSTVDGPAAHLEPIPTAEIKLTMEADATGMDMLTMLRGGTTLFLRISATGPIIELAIPFSFVFDAPVKVIDISEFSDEEGVYAIEVTFTVVYDSAYGTMRATVTNQLAGL